MNTCPFGDEVFNHRALKFLEMAFVVLTRLGYSHLKAKCGSKIQTKCLTKAHMKDKNFQGPVSLSKNVIKTKTQKWQNLHPGFNMV